MGHGGELIPFDIGMFVKARIKKHSISKITTALGYIRATMPEGRQKVIQEQDRQRLTSEPTSERSGKLHQTTS